MIREVSSSLSVTTMADAATTTVSAALQAADTSALVAASRVQSGLLDSNGLANRLIDQSGGDRDAFDSLSQDAARGLSPVEQGALRNSIDGIFDKIREAIEKLIDKIRDIAEQAAERANQPLPPTASDSASVPSLEAVANDPAVRSAINASWDASNPNTPGAKQETGFWVVRDDKTGQLSTVAFPSNGTRDSLTPGPVPSAPGQTVVAFFHTHPNTTSEGYISGPSPADLNFARATGLPGIIRSHDGMYFFNPPK